jgi:hypothetical protein
MDMFDNETGFGSDILVDLIDMREKKGKNILYKKKENICFIIIFLFE